MRGARPRSWDGVVAVWLALGAGMLAVAIVIRLVPAVYGTWSERLQPAWTHLLVPVTERGSLPWTPLAAALLLAATVAMVRRARGRGRRWLVVGASLALIAGGFELSWGLHALRPAVEERLALAQASGAPPTASAMEAAALELAAIVASTLPSGAFDEAPALASTRASLQNFAPAVRLPRRVKYVSGVGFGTLGVAGVISPWTLEAHVDGQLPAWARVVVAGHELAHLAGFEREGEAELVGLLAGLRAANPHARYAAALRAWMWMPAEARRAAPLPARAQADLDALAAAGERRAEGLASLAWSVYERYLVARGQGDGIAGYAQAAVLLVRAHEAGWWTAAD